MSPRVAGAALALLAAVLLVASVIGVPTGWWSGSPLRNGEPMHKKDVDVSMISAVGCNTGGDGSCEPLAMTATFDTVRYAELGTSGILALACLLLAGAALVNSEPRKRLGTSVIVLAVISAGAAVALFFIPKMAIANIELPIGPGLFVFFGGIACSILGSVLAMRPTPKLELQPPRQSFAPSLAPPPTAQPVDVLAMLQPDPPPQQQPLPPPILDSGPHRPPPSPGGQLAGPAGPLAPPTFGGALPLATPPPPPPRSTNQVPAMPAAPTKSSGQLPAMPAGAPTKGTGNLPAMPDSRPKPPSMAPPPRSKPPSIAPAEARTKAASIAPSIPPPVAPGGPLARPKSPSAPPSMAPIPSTVAGLMPPAPVRGKPATGLPPPRAKGPSVPPPATAPKKPTTVAAVVPPPAGHTAPMAATMLPMRAETDPTDALETMDRDAMTIARDGAPAVSIGRPATDVSVGDSTDASVALPGDGTGDESTDLGAEPIPPLEARDSASDIQTSAQRKLTHSELVRTVARESQTEIETIAREKFSARDLAIGDSTSPAIHPSGRARSEIEELGEAPTERAPSLPARTAAAAAAAAAAKLPVSTAPESLPPPKKADVAVSGPTPACPQCEAPMAWVEEHLRFYCKSCRMYF